MSSPNHLNVFEDARTYYASDERHKHLRAGARTPTFLGVGLPEPLPGLGAKEPFRRRSHDGLGVKYSKQFLIDVDATLETLQSQEDTDGNMQITIEDSGPKVFTLRTAASNGHNPHDIRGTYMLSNLMQELTLAKEYGRQQIILDEARLNENPVDRLARMIRDQFWDSLTRRIDASSIEIAAKDPKDWTDDPRPRIYVPPAAPELYKYYTKLAEERPEIRLDVQLLPEKITPEHVRDMNEKPGLLAVAMEEVEDPVTSEKTLRGLPFVVPGGRFNEFYGWDSYFESLGLLINDKVDLAKSMVEIFCFCIRHYGKILNATRSYYLCRSQPPFLTDMALRVYDRIRDQPGAKEFLRAALLAAIKEYHTIWVAEPRLDPVTGLSRYRPGRPGRPSGDGGRPLPAAAHAVHGEAQDVVQGVCARVQLRESPRAGAGHVLHARPGGSGIGPRHVLPPGRHLRGRGHHRPQLAAVQVRDGHRQDHPPRVRRQAGRAGRVLLRRHAAGPRADIGHLGPARAEPQAGHGPVPLERDGGHVL